MHKPRTHISGILPLIVLGVCLAAPGPLHAAPSTGGESAIERSPEGFPVPTVGRAEFQGWIRRDLTKQIPGEETLFKQYVDEWGFLFETLTINGVVFAYNLDVDGRFPYDITLLDTNCDGIFETKVEEKPGQRVDLPIPDCVFRLESGSGK